MLTFRNRSYIDKSIWYSYQILSLLIDIERKFYNKIVVKHNCEIRYMLPYLKYNVELTSYIKSVDMLLNI